MCSPPIPESLSFEQAAALPLVLLTGAQLIERAAKVQTGQTILIIGALGSVGRVAVHVARTHGAHVIAGVRAAQKEEASTLGAARIVALDDPKETIHLRELDAVADTVGGLVQEHTLKMLKYGGVYASVVGPPKQDPGRSIRVAAMMAVPDASRLYELADEVARGGLVIPIAKTFPLSEIQQAMQLAEKRRSRRQGCSYHTLSALQQPPYRGHQALHVKVQGLRRRLHAELSQRGAGDRPDRAGPRSVLALSEPHQHPAVKRSSAPSMNS